jgi:uncharacterized membrane protein
VNDRFGTLLLAALVYLAASWMYRRMTVNGDNNVEARLFDAAEPKLLDPALAVLGNLVLLVALSLEIRSWFDALAGRSVAGINNMQMAEQAAYSMLFAVYAAAAVVVGMLLRWPTLRVIGLAGLALTLLKVFFVDLASLELMPRILALAVLGIMLLGVSFLYQKFKHSVAPASRR